MFWVGPRPHISSEVLLKGGALNAGSTSGRPGSGGRRARQTTPYPSDLEPSEREDDVGSQFLTVFRGLLAAAKRAKLLFGVFSRTYMQTHDSFTKPCCP
eukprot:gene12520-biopygen6452